MVRKAKQSTAHKTEFDAYIAGAGTVVEQPITETLEQNYMPYAMSVIISRALPEIDGFKPSHRKLLYTMYKMGLLNGNRTKSANIVGQTMRLNPHGDAAIYETMVRLSAGCEALLHPYIDSKGNFGKAYSRDMQYAASRYTEAKLAKICSEIFSDIDKNTVDMVPNYDNTMTEPALLPTTYPAILVNSNVGIAVSMASNICPFNLKEICQTTIELLKNPGHDITLTLQGPDFPGGGIILYDKAELEKIIRTGRGSIKVRARYNYDKANNCIEVTQIPPSTTIEAIMDKTIDLIKQGKIKDITDIRDETDLSGLKLTFDLKRGVDPDRLMQILYRSTPLQDTFSCNFNVLINGYPKVMGIREILNEWIIFRTSCVRRKVSFDLKQKQEKLHLLQGLKKILMDIDKAIKIVRETEEEKEVVPNLMIGFGIDEIQAEYVAEIKLRHLNREYILNRTNEIESLEETIADLQETLKKDSKVRAIIIADLKRVMKDHMQPRKSIFLYDVDEEEENIPEEIPDYPVNLFLTKEGYFKKITPQSLRMSSNHKLKEGDEIILHLEQTNAVSMLIFTDKAQVYKTRACDFDDTKASVFGEYLPAKLGFDSNEKIVGFITTKDYSGHILFFFENGKAAKVPLSSYETKTNRKKLTNAYCSKFPLTAIFDTASGNQFLMESTDHRYLLVLADQIPEKATRDSQGVNTMAFRKNKSLLRVIRYQDGSFVKPERYTTEKLPSTGMLLAAADKPHFEDTQLTLGE